MKGMSRRKHYCTYWKLFISRHPALLMNTTILKARVLAGVLHGRARESKAVRSVSKLWGSGECRPWFYRSSRPMAF